MPDKNAIEWITNLINTIGEVPSDLPYSVSSLTIDFLEDLKDVRKELQDSEDDNDA